MNSMILMSSKNVLLERNIQPGGHGFLSSNLAVPVLGNGETHQSGFCSLLSLRSNCSFIALRKERSRSQPHLDRGVLRSRKIARSSTSITRTAETESTTSGDRSNDYEIKGTVILQNVAFRKLMNVAFLNVPNLYAPVVDAFIDFLGGGKVLLQLVSRDQVDSEGKGKTIGQYSDLKWTLGKGFKSKTEFEIKFKWNSALGFPGAFRIKNMHSQEFLLKSLTIFIPTHGKVCFECNSWIFPPSLQPIDRVERVFFANKSFLPEETPMGLRKLRELDLKFLQGDGTGERKVFDHIYDYDVYNDLGISEENNEEDEPRREVLGGSQDFPYPRRCRTGRPLITGQSFGAHEFETRTSSIFIPPDERFPYTEGTDFEIHLILAIANSIIPKLVYIFYSVFNSFEDINWLYERESRSADSSSSILPQDRNPFQYIPRPLIDVWRELRLVKFRRPQIIEAHGDAWSTDEEFARQTLAGLNPIVIECLQKFPPSSNLNETMYGPRESNITAQHIEENLESLSVNQAIEEKRLFIVDYYDAYMPYVKRINKFGNGAKIYASRTVYFRTNEGTLKPVAIELCLPPIDENAAVRKVCTPGEDRAEEEVWKLAKVHAKVNDAGYHQLVSHWLRTHCITEPFIIATHRQLSKMHPVYKLLVPHYHGTMDINQTARQKLISASGTIEQNFASGRYSMEMSSNAYKQWKFNEQGLEADLLKRGMAVRDANAPNGLKLVIEDYPYAVDGIEIWFALKEWVSEYLAIYYKDDASVKKDNELKAWWDEIVNVGHGDLKDDPSRWYRMDTLDDAKQIATTIIWTASAHHAAVNFGQYSYGGYMPNLPTISRRLIPDEGTTEYDELRIPDRFLIDTLPNPEQTLRVMPVLEVLSKHAKHEVYVGQSPGSTTDKVDDPRVEEIFTKFSNNLEKIERNIKERNGNRLYKNRNGPAKIPYTLLFPSTSDSSQSGGLTGCGVPNSISI